MGFGTLGLRNRYGRTTLQRQTMLLALASVMTVGALGDCVQAPIQAVQDEGFIRIVAGSAL